ncbi:uncharacterized protein LOC135338358 [Halichondria panicea]|uniref:uncharacterized protein LOC135338358 n=1 Tax=Halichondria panicea TaxID=6063 RepID=UPI00312B7701
MQAAGKEQDDSAIQNRIEQIYKRAIDSGYTTSDSESNDLEPIVDFSTSPKEDIKTLVELLSADDPETIEKMNSSQLLGRLLKYVPQKLNHYLTNTSTTQASGNQCKYCHKNYWYATNKLQYTCVQCCSKICRSCRPISRQIYGYGKTTNVFICNSCIEQFYQEHAKEWRDKAHTLIEGGSLEDLKAAFGCIQIALSLFNEISLTSTGKQLFHHNYPELALPFALAAQQQASKTIDKVKANKFLSSVFKSLTTRYDDQNIRWELLLGAKEAALLAKSEADHLDEQIADAPSLQTAVDEINQELQLSRRQKEDEEARQMRSLRREIERYWESRNLRAMIDFILSPDDDDGQRASRLEAFEQFMQSMEGFISKMCNDDRYSLTFFRGVLKLSKKRFAEGITDIEQVAWQSHSVDLLKHESINILLSLLKTQPPIFTLNGLHKICAQPQKLLSPKGIYNDFSLRELQLIAMDEAEITPPFKGQWPELSVTGLNLRAHRKCEAAFASQIQEKKWGSQDVGYAYIDYIQGCVHPAEITVSLLHASMWFFKDLKENDQIQLPQTFALKKLIFSLLSMAYTIAQRSLHPGMQLYVGRIALAVALETLKRKEDVALAEDTELISALLHMVTYNSRFVPFWKFPSVQVSEAALLSIISAEQHTKYLDQLTETDKTQRPVTEAELQYQLYENDLRYVHRAEDPASLHVKAMKELLAEKGWKMSDVSRLMTSPLSPRDRDGWLIQQPKLGLNQEFAEIKGMIINLDHHNPSIELVVVPADDLRGRMGTCSQADFQHVLSMVDEADGTLFFSLDQPDSQKRFHPFQEFRYTSESLNKSDLLHTLFETDYLMKSFSVGTDVSSNPPFKQRPNKEGLTKNLPKVLQEKLKPVSERGTTQNRAHRFWIQADKIDYNEEQNNNRLEIRLGEMDMIIRSHPLIPGEDGKLIDTTEDDDPDSPEARFAADMTEVYNELGLHFPMFLRLRQLAKLQVLGLFLRGILKGMKEKSEGKGIVVPTELLQEIQRDALQSAKEQLQRGLNSISSDIGEWPAAEDRNTVSTEVERVLRELPYNVIASYSDVEPHVKSALQKKDDSVVSQLSDALMDATSNRLTRSTLTQYVRTWLQNRSSRNLNDLVSYLSSAVSLPTREDIKSQIVAHSKERYESFSNLVRTLICLPNKRTSTSPCKWVPAALYKEEDGSHLSLCYGGVLIAPKINEGNVSRFPGHSQRVPVQKAPQVFSNATNGLGAQIRSPQTGSKPQTQRGTRGQSQSGTKRQTQSEVKPQNQSGSRRKTQSGVKPQTQSQQTQNPQGGTKSATSSTTQKAKWDFSKKDDKQRKWTNFEKHGQKVFRLYGDDNPPIRRASKTLAACTAAAVGVYGVGKLLQTFGDKKMKADTALREVSKNLEQNPSCKRTSCSACAINNIRPVTSIKTTSGNTFETTNSVSMDTKNCVYMVQCIKTGKMYIGMTTRQAITRVREHLRDITKEKAKTLARHFNDLGCFGQFNQSMNIVPLGSVSSETMKPYTPSQRKRIMEYIEAKLIEAVGRDQLLNKKWPSTSFSEFDATPNLDQFFSKRADGIYIDGKLALTID